MQLEFPFILDECKWLRRPNVNYQPLSTIQEKGIYKIKIGLDLEAKPGQWLTISSDGKIRKMAPDEATPPAGQILSVQHFHGGNLAFTEITVQLSIPIELLAIHSMGTAVAAHECSICGAVGKGHYPCAHVTSYTSKKG